MNIETFTRYNGNDQLYTKPIPKVVILCKTFNDTALAWFAKNTGIEWKKDSWGNVYGQPMTAAQFVLIFMTYNFKTEYHDNACSHNTLYLKFCTEEGFKVHKVCPTCASENGIHWPDAKPEDRHSV